MKLGWVDTIKSGQGTRGLSLLLKLLEIKKAYAIIEVIWAY